MNNESEKELEVAEPIEVEEETTDENVEDDDNLEFDEPDNDSENNIEKEESEKEKPNKQSAEENSTYAQIRRKAEKDAELKSQKQIEDAYQKGRLEAYKGKINPHTGTEIKDITDIEVFEDMERIAQNGGDPLKDYASYTADKKREEEKLAQEKQEREEQAQKEVDEFTKKYPDVNLSDLFKDEMFKDYAEGKTKSLTEIYESYNKLKKSFRNKGVEVAKQTIANSMSSPGGLNQSSDNHVDYENMSREEFLKEVEKVKER
ncbi:MAG: hypothetical protein HFE81_03510 [Bacilli bacterium]|nr:hypothetical protein [Bacilli bacterium]